MPTFKIRISAPKETREIIEKLKPLFNGEYRLIKTAIESLDILYSLGFRWYHVKVLHKILTKDTAYRDWKESIEETVAPILEFLDSLIKDMARENPEDLRIFFSERELKRVLQDVNSS